MADAREVCKKVINTQLTDICKIASVSDRKRKVDKWELYNEYISAVRWTGVITDTKYDELSREDYFTLLRDTADSFNPTIFELDDTHLKFSPIRRE